MNKYVILLCAILFFSISYAQNKMPDYAHNIQKENLGRGLVAIHNNTNQISVSWRLLESDPIDVAFNVYRAKKKGKAIKLNKEPITKSTFYIDSISSISEYTYSIRIEGKNTTEACYTLTPTLASLPYLRIPIQPIKGDTAWRYSPNDASIGDLDGDGEYEIVLKRENSGKDNSFRGLCDGPAYLEAYKLDGRMMWRVNLGGNIRQGAHYIYFIVFDFDGDGKAEIATRTSEGTIFGDNTKIGDTNGDGITDYVDKDPNSPTFGKIMTGPEFLSVIEGKTGKELARTDYISRGTPHEFGDNNGNRVDRFLGGVGYFDGVRPSILICRGYYEKTVLEAWDYRDGKLTQKWKFSSTDNDGEYRDYEGQGNHNLSIGDVDGDGHDEIVYGACCIDHDGRGLYNTHLGHGDAMHLTDIDIDHPGLEVWDCHEHAPSRAGSEMRDARTGALLWGIPSVEDVGRAMCADIDPRFRGCEVWTSASNGVYTANGRFITEHRPSINMAVWWDNDLNRELLDGSGVDFRPRRMPQGFRMDTSRRAMPWGAPNANGGFVSIAKWNGDGTSKFTLPDEENITMNNYTKSNPCVYGDIVGDWREEVLVRTKNNKEIRLYMTNIATDYRFYTLNQDIIYRLSAANQNNGYNQPTQTGFYLGSDLGKFWEIRYILATRNGKQGTSSNGRPNGLNERFDGAQEITIRDIECRRPSYTHDARFDYDSYEWTVNGKLIGAGRYLTLTADEYGYDTPISIKIRTTYHGCVFEDSGTVRFVKPINH